MIRRIALLTDFGTRDPYVAAMKGVIASRCEASTIDLTHEIAPFDVFEGAWFLRAVAAEYPPGTIFVAVVDPGVGSERRILAASSRERIFLAPDNGLLSLAIDETANVHSVENRVLFLPKGSTTFHGRDRFAPVAAALASGARLESLGSRVELSSIVRLDYEPPAYGAEESRGTIVAVDRFGNLVTDLEGRRLPESYALRVRDRSIERRARSYAEMRGNAEPFLIVGSRGTVEISVANGSAADLLQLGRFERVVIR